MKGILSFDFCFYLQGFFDRKKYYCNHFHVIAVLTNDIELSLLLIFSRYQS